MTSAFCTHCGAALHGARFCTACGTPVAGEPTQTVVASDGAETELKPRPPAPVARTEPLTVPPPPIAGLPPMASIPPVMPVLQPRARKSPWPWIAVGAVLALSAGAGTAVALWPRHSDASTTPTGSTGSAAAVPTITATATVTQTVAQPTASGSMSDSDAASAIAALVNTEARLHKPWDVAIGKIRLMCNGQRGSEKPIPYDQGQLDSWVSSVQDFGRQRRQLAGGLDPVISQTTGQANDLAVRLRTIWTLLADVDDNFAAWATQAGQNCQTFHQPEPTAPAAASIATRVTWLNDFGPFAGDPPIVTALLEPPAAGSGL